MEREYLSREPRQYTKKEKLQNWFYYNKWWLAVAALIVYVAGSMIWKLCWKPSGSSNRKKVLKPSVMSARTDIWAA